MNSFVFTDGILNVSGLLKLEFIPVQHVVLIADDVDSIVIPAITILAGKAWLTGEFTVGKLEYGDEGKLSASGFYHEQEASGFHPYLSATKTNNFRNMQNNKFVVLAHDTSGFNRIIGSLESPCDFTFKETTGNIGGTVTKGYYIKFFTSSTIPALYYQAPVSVGGDGIVTIYKPDGVTVYTTKEPPETFTIPYATNFMFKNYMSSDAAIAGSAANKKIFVEFIGYPIERISVVLQGAGLLGQLTTLSAAKKILTAWNSGTGEATFKSDVPADNQITVFAYTTL
jgi:hypothetical protein